MRGFGRKDFQVRLSVRAADRRLGFPGREAGGSSARPGHACFSVRRNAAVQRGKAMLVSRFAGVQHARSRAALHCAGSAPQCSIASPLEAARRAAALHYSSRSGLGSVFSHGDTACLKTLCVDAMKIHMCEHVYQHVQFHVLSKCICDAPTHVRGINRCMCVNMCIRMFSCTSSTNGSAMRQHMCE